MSKADHFVNLEDKGLYIDIKNGEDGCDTKMESTGVITTTSTDTIQSEANKQILANVKESKTSIKEDEILLATKEASIMLNNDKIVFKIGNSSIVMDSSSISIESGTINVKSSANTNIQATQNVGVEGLNTNIKAKVAMNAEGVNVNIKGSAIASIKGGATTMVG
jgi:hypothetical protein